jgi:hypothetical protein
LKATFLAISILALSSYLLLPAVSATSSNTPPLSLPMTGTEWSLLSVTCSASGNCNSHASPADTIPNGGVFFVFPNAGPSTSTPTYASEFTITFALSLTSSDSITASIDIPTTCPPPTGGLSPCPTTSFVGNPNGNACGTATSVRLFFHSTGTNSFPTQYWWSNNLFGSSYTITTGGTATTMQIGPVPMTGTSWTDFYGKPGTGVYAAGFADAIQNIKDIGLSFGSGCFFANGVGVNSATGTANFELLNYYVS